jgi:TonB-dependent SusC/RagA subfamily outer membrane receptor
MRKRFFTGLLILLASFTAQAQEMITGKVIAGQGAPVSGATVMIKGTSSGTTSANDGSFSLAAKAGDVLKISYVGYKNREVLIGKENTVTIVLSELVGSLDALVVTGYTTQRVKEISGSVAIVKPEDLTAIPAGQVQQMLQGRVAGLTIIHAGEPGSPASMRLHGIGNTGDIRPLVIIDGVEGNLNFVNPYDIESIQVLKDAGAYSIYGVRGANGVIVITTKRGKGGKTRIVYEGYAGIVKPLKRGLELLNPQENADLLWLAMKNSGLVDPATGNPTHKLYGNGPKPILPDYLSAGQHKGLFEGDPRVNPTLYNLDPDAKPIYQIVRFNKEGTDWFHESFKPAINQYHGITASGGSDKNNYLFSWVILISREH